MLGTIRIPITIDRQSEVGAGDRSRTKETQTVDRSFLYLIVGALAVVTVVLSYRLYEERQRSSIGISVGGNSVSIEKH